VLVSGRGAGVGFFRFDVFALASAVAAIMFLGRTAELLAAPFADALDTVRCEGFGKRKSNVTVGDLDLDRGSLECFHGFTLRCRSWLGLLVIVDSFLS
jgi:hypothetical protein